MKFNVKPVYKKSKLAFLHGLLRPVKADEINTVVNTGNTATGGTPLTGGQTAVVLDKGNRVPGNAKHEICSICRC